MQYRASFALRTFVTFAFTFTELIAVMIAVRQVPHLAGWTIHEVALLFGLSTICFGLGEALAVGFDGFHTRIVDGSFDRLLVRPLGAFFQTFAWEIGVRRLGRLGGGVIGLVWGLGGVSIEWSLDRLVVLVLGTASGTAIFFFIFVIGAASAFWTIQGVEVVNVFTNGGNMVTSYPLDVYEGWLRRFLTFVVPLAFVNYYPMLDVLGRPDPLGLPDWVRLASPLTAVAIALLAYGVWSIGVRRYQSTG